tara:strand:- start:18 stop:467 length:450 start_codon:yes stop_codon:yes gene_type:complete
MKVRFIDEQIIAMIKEQEAGEKTADVCRRHGISSAALYKCKSKYGGMEPSDAKRLRALDDENAKLKWLLAEQLLGEPCAPLVRAQWGAPFCETPIQKMVTSDARRQAVVQAPYTGQRMNAKDTCHCCRGHPRTIGKPPLLATDQFGERS